ncbi:MAG: hypothetical protein IT207_07395 [Fimbriimonadaceae bacterium]|nr:hypothetical protein [Fimbriimonadaceae bacterium]
MKSVQLPSILSGTYNEVRVEVEISPATETSLVEVWVESSSPSQPLDELDREVFPLPQEPPPYAVVPEAVLACKFDSTHWEHGEDVEFWLYATVWHNGQTTSIQPILLTTRSVYNAAVLIQHKQLALVAGGSGAALGFELWNHTVTKNIFNNSWSANTVTADMPPATSHLILAHGTPGVVWAPAAPTAVNDTVVSGAVPGGPFPLYFAFLASCRVAENNNAAVPDAYLSEATGTANRCVVAFKVTLKNAEMLSLYFDIVERVFDGKTVGRAAKEAWDASTMKDDYDLEFDDAMYIAGDEHARPRWLYDGTNYVHTDWKRNT